MSFLPHIPLTKMAQPRNADLIFENQKEVLDDDFVISGEIPRTQNDQNENDNVVRKYEFYDKLWL